MTETQIQLVRNTWSYVIVNADEAGELFYNRLFQVAPAVRPMFQGNQKEQARKLMNMVTLIVAKLDKLGDIMHEVKGLARRHNRYGAKPEHYDVVGDCLLWTLEKGLGDRWTTEVKTAWTAVYTLLANAMIEAQAEPAAVVL